MANRHLSRSIVLQTLFEWDVQSTHERAVEVEEVLKRNVEEFAPDAGDFSYMQALMQGIIAKQSELDAVIEKAAPEWPIDKISTIDRNILRIGLFELLFGDRKEVPAKVAINEAIELGKNFGGESSGKFINGVLGAVYKDIGEPGKGDATAREGKSIPTKHLCGAVIFARTDDGIKFALVHDVFGKWTLSKSRKDDNEAETACACRAVQNEMGLSAKTITELGSNEYIAAHPEEGKMRKQVTYFLAEAPYQDIVVDKSGGLNDARWFSEKEIEMLEMYEDIRPIIEKAVAFVEKES